MFRTAALAVTLIALAAAPALAQEAEPRLARLTLSAEGEVRLAPDQATVSAGVVTQGDTAAEAVQANAAAMSRVFRELRRAGVEERDMQTSQLSVNPIYSRPDHSSNSNQSPRITGYEARNTVSAMVRDIQSVGEVVDAVFEAGANTLNGVSFSSSQADAARDDARRLAVTALHARRDLYAEAVGFETVRLIHFAESERLNPMPVAMMARAESFDASTPVAAGELIVRASVRATWEISE